MSNQIAARGHTTVILFLDMRYFIPLEHRQAFEALRGTPTFHKILLEEWHEALKKHPYFQCCTEWGQKEKLSEEETGFATGIFRERMLSAYMPPAYILNKSKITFPDTLRTNLQFKSLFLPVWKKWDIQIRPTMTGFFTLRLTAHYKKAVPFISLAKDVLRLQAPFDIPSALHWLQHIETLYQNSPEEHRTHRESILELLRWLGADHQKEPWLSHTVLYSPIREGLYYPVQWKLALEVAKWLVQETTLSLPLGEKGQMIKLLPPADPHPAIFSSPPKPKDDAVKDTDVLTDDGALPLFDSYIVYYIEEILAPPQLIGKSQKVRQKEERILVGPKTLREAPAIRNALTSLLEGTVLHHAKDKSHTTATFPTPRWSQADRLFQNDPQRNLGSWNDEVYIVGPRATLIIPSRRWREYTISISTMPGSLREVPYRDYWRSIERMIEFVMEVGTLARLVETDTYELLTRIANTVETVRSGMFQGDIRINGPLKKQVIEAAHLRRMASLVQRLSHVALWSRAEYSRQKAWQMLQELDVPLILEHIQRNIDSINAVADHIDELYLADLSEKNNAKTTVLSIVMAALPLLLTVIAFPSFWADWEQVIENHETLSQTHIPMLIAGGLLTLIAISFSIYFLWRIFRNWHNVRQIFTEIF